RALRILFASLPHLCFVGTRDGFAARADLPDEDGERRHCGNECEVGEPFRQLPGLHGMHDGVPFGSGLRKADRSDARANRAKDGTLAGRKTPPAICIRNFYAAGALAANALAIACLKVSNTNRRWSFVFETFTRPERLRQMRWPLLAYQKS